MQLYLMRHGEAGFEAPSDKERPLTDSGRHHTHLMSEFLSRFVTGFDLVLVSPYLRAEQTWQELSTHFPTPKHCLILGDLVPAAEPSRTACLIDAYAEQYNAENVLVISHMPLLGYLVSELVRGVEPPLFATSGVCRLDKQAGQYAQSWSHNPHTIS